MNSDKTVTTDYGDSKCRVKLRIFDDITEIIKCKVKWPESDISGHNLRFPAQRKCKDVKNRGYAHQADQSADEIIENHKRFSTC